MMTNHEPESIPAGAAPSSAVPASAVLDGAGLDKATAEHLAAVIHVIRADWDSRGIVAALGKVRHRPIATIVVAAVRAAVNPAARTPEVIALDGTHWQQAAAATVSDAERHPSNVPYTHACAHCGRSEHDCREARRNGVDDPHEFVSRRQAVIEQEAIQRARADRNDQAAAKPAWSPSERPYLPSHLRWQIRAGLAEGQAAFAARQAQLDERRQRAAQTNQNQADAASA